MMKKRLVAAAVASCIAGPMTAQAVNLSANDTGEVLLYPYYNVNEGNTTFVSVTNTTDYVKAVKVRFREGVGSEDVFDFTLYLSPKDVWVGAVSQQSGRVKLTVPSDNSCTVPVASALEAAYFSDARIDSRYDPDESGTQSAEEVLARLSEGHIEIIEMAELPYDTSNSPDDGSYYGEIADAVTHGSGVGDPPPDCTVPTTFTGAADAAILLEDTVEFGGVRQAFSRPRGGLFGNAAIFNPASGIYFPYNAQALENFADEPLWWAQNAKEFDDIVSNPSGLSVDEFETADQGTTVPKGSEGGATLNFDLPDLSTPDYDEAYDGTASAAIFENGPDIEGGYFDGTTGVDPLDPDFDEANLAKAQAVTAALMGVGLQGEYLTSSDFATDWLITFPTRYLMVADDADRWGDDDLDTLARDPFTEGEDPASGQACHDVDFDYWNREEDKNEGDTGVGVSPGLPPEQFSLCYEVNVLALNNGSEYSESLASKAVKASVDLQFGDGWATIGLDSYSLTSTDGALFNGLPITGFNAVSDLVEGTEKGGVFTNRVNQQASSAP